MSVQVYTERRVVRSAVHVNQQVFFAPELFEYGGAMVMVRLDSACPDSVVVLLDANVEVEAERLCHELTLSADEAKKMASKLAISWRKFVVEQLKKMNVTQGILLSPQQYFYHVLPYGLGGRVLPRRALRRVDRCKRFQAA